MKITIDTNEDSKEHIKKLIHMLSALVDEPIKYATSRNIFEDTTPSTNENTESEGGVFGNLFGDTNTDNPSSSYAEFSQENQETAEAQDTSDGDSVELQYY